MKYTILLLFVFLMRTLSVNAQLDRTQTQNNPRGLIGINFPTSLYEGVTYEFWALANGYEDTDLKGENVTIERDPNDPFKYYVTPIEPGKCTLTVVALIPSIGKTIEMRKDTYLVKENPEIDMRIGRVKSGGVLENELGIISCGYSVNERSDSQFNTISWTLTIDKLDYTGVGKDMSDEAIKAIAVLDDKEPIVLTATFDFDGEKKELVGVYLK